MPSLTWNIYILLPGQIFKLVAILAWETLRRPVGPLLSQGRDDLCNSGVEGGGETGRPGLSD